MAGFFAELKRRKVYRVAIAYAVGGWVVIQVATQVFPPLELPNWTVKLVIAAVVLGFPIAMILSWAFDITPEGIKRTEDVDLAPASPHTIAPGEIPEKSIAVLPFENLSDDQQNTYFADGIQDDILSSLTKVADLKVISRTSVRQFRGIDRNLREIGQALGVAHILEGTVRRVGNRVRVNTQLINARTDSHVWGDTFDREVTDLFALQSELAEQIVAALQANISPREMANIQIHPTNDMAAYDLFLRARDLFHWSGTGDPLENGEQALRLVDQAVARDPQFASAYALASRLHAELYWFGHDRSRGRLTKAKAAADVALRLAPDEGDPHVALAFFYYYGTHDYERARAEIGIAKRVTPNDAEAWDASGAIERRDGRWNDAVTNFEKARYLDPRNFSVISNLAETLIALRRYPEARDVIDTALLINPDAHIFTIERAMIDMREKGDLTSLRRALRAIPSDFDPGGAVTLMTVRLSLMEHDCEEASRLLNASHHSRLTDIGSGGTASMLDGYTFPKAWYEGLVARDRGNIDAARHAFEAAARVVEADLGRWPDDAKGIMMLAMIHAALDEKKNALSEARRATELLPIAKDAYDGPLLATNLAAIYACVGEHDHAIEQLTSLMHVPNGPTPGLLQIETEWNSLRDDPRFQKLAAG